MTLHIHKLAGCTPTPLAHYLKALGILRLVAEQKDKSARGWWKNNVFHLTTNLDEKSLLDFFLYEYEPTPLLAPWNAASGFYENKPGAIEILEQSECPRFNNIKQAILQCKIKETPLFLETLQKAQEAKRLLNKNKSDKELKIISQKADSQKKSIKDLMTLRCHQTWRGQLEEWICASSAIFSDEQQEGPLIRFPLAYGMGGADAKIDFSRNFIEALVFLFKPQNKTTQPTKPSVSLLKNALLNYPSNDLVSKKGCGMFLPGSTKAGNGTSGFIAEPQGNPWDLVLLLEGGLVQQTSVATLYNKKQNKNLSSPFSVSPASANIPSEPHGEENSAGEQWLPMWASPATFTEVCKLFIEGRATSKNFQSSTPNNSAKTASTALEFSKAVASLAIPRGIDSFIRYSYIKRSGQAHFAVPIQKWAVPKKSNPKIQLLDQIVPWLEKLRLAEKNKNIPQSIVRVSQNCSTAFMECCRKIDDPNRWLRMLTALGDAEAQLVGSPKTVGDPKKNLRPLPPLSSGWLLAADTGKPELRLALALALQGGFKNNGKPDWSTSIRHHFVPLDVSSYRFAPASDASAWKNELIGATDLERTARGIVHRRLIQQKNSGTFPLGPTSHTTTIFSDLLAFLEHRTDDSLILSLLRPLMAIRKPSGLQALSRPLNDTRTGDLAIYAVLKLCHLPWPIPISEHGIAVRTDPAIFARLQAGDLHQAIAIAVRRLKASGLRPHIETAMGTGAESHRLAAALAFPLSIFQSKTCALSLTRPTLETTIKNPSDDSESAR